MPKVQRILSAIFVFAACGNGAESPPDDALDPCIGTPVPCENLAFGACDNAQNCLFVGQCVGSVAGDAGVECATSASTALECATFAGCQWQAACVPSGEAPAVCASLTNDQCASEVPGCNLASAAPTHDASDFGDASLASDDFGACGGAIAGDWELVTQWIPTRGFFNAGCDGAPMVDGTLTFADGVVTDSLSEMCQGAEIGVERTAMFTASASVLTLNAGTQGAETYAYCVAGDYLTIVGTDGAFTLVSVD